MTKLKLIMLHCLTPLIIGGILYISFRSLRLEMFNWFEYIGIDNYVLIIRNGFSTLKFIPEWAYYSLPDGLWMYSFSSSLIILWGKEFECAKYWLLIPIFSGTFIELAQGLKIFPGTFDLLDLTFTILALILSIIIINSKIKKNDKQKQAL